MTQHKYPEKREQFGLTSFHIDDKCLGFGEDERLWDFYKEIRKDIREKIKTPPIYSTKTPVIHSDKKNAPKQHFFWEVYGIESGLVVVELTGYGIEREHGILTKEKKGHLSGLGFNIREPTPMIAGSIDTLISSYISTLI
jgi:hypothetical protein